MQWAKCRPGAWRAEVPPNVSTFLADESPRSRPADPPLFLTAARCRTARRAAGQFHLGRIGQSCGAADQPVAATRFDTNPASTCDNRADPQAARQVFGA